MRRTMLALTLLASSAFTASAQVANPGIQRDGAVTPGNFTQWLNSYSVKDAGFSVVPQSRGGTGATTGGAALELMITSPTVGVVRRTSADNYTTTANANVPDLACGTAWNMLVRNASAWQCLAQGTAGQVLTAAASAVPTWTTIAGVYAPLASPTFTGSASFSGNMNITGNVLEFGNTGMSNNALIDWHTNGAGDYDFRMLAAPGANPVMSFQGGGSLDLTGLAGGARTKTVTAGDNSTNIASTAFVTSAVSTAVAAVKANPPGALLDFAGGACPANTLVADGTAVSRTTYAALFAAIGTRWGAGDGSTTFNLPNLTAKFARGGIAANVGVSGGSDTVTLVAANLPPHTHDISSAAANPLLGPGTTNTPASSTATKAAPQSDNGPGTSTPFSVVPAYATVLKCVWF